MLTSLLRALAAFAAGLLLATSACDDGGDPPVDGDADSDVDGDVDGDGDGDADSDGGSGCAACHGSGDEGAPPPGLSGATDPSDPGVGAHATHLIDGDDRAAVHCRHCHEVPGSEDAPGHVDDERPADVTLSGLATLWGEASYGTGTCTTYCHGSFFRVNAAPSPEWTAGEGGLACDGCHGLPPAAPHPDDTQCGRCHIDAVALDGTILLPSFHIDGVLQAPHHGHLPHLGGAGGTFYECTDCHIGDDYHGPLIDGGTLDDTTICEDCHAAGEVSPDDWRDYVWPAS